MVDNRKSIKISVDNYNKLVDMKVDNETIDCLISRLIVNFPFLVDKPVDSLSTMSTDDFRKEYYKRNNIQS